MVIIKIDLNFINFKCLIIKIIQLFNYFNYLIILVDQFIKMTNNDNTTNSNNIIDKNNIVDEIINVYNSNNNLNILLYPKIKLTQSTEFADVLKPQSILMNSKNDNLLKSFTTNLILIEENKFRNFSEITEITEITKMGNNNTSNTSKIYAKTQIFGKIFNETLLCVCNCVEIDQSQFPIATSGLLKETKHIKILNIPELNLKFVKLVIENDYFCIIVNLNKKIKKQEIFDELLKINQYIEKFY